MDIITDDKQIYNNILTTFIYWRTAPDNFEIEEIEVTEFVQTEDNIFY